MAKEYIEREAFDRELQNIVREYNKNCESDKSSGAFESLYRFRLFPAADVVEVVHGEWKFDENAYDWGIGAWVCSECGCKNDNINAQKHQNPYAWAGSKYCPNCGAKMDGERKEV